MDLKRLLSKHNAKIDGCGCCESPRIDFTEDNSVYLGIVVGNGEKLNLDLVIDGEAEEIDA